MHLFCQCLMFAWFASLLCAVMHGVAKKHGPLGFVIGLLVSLLAGSVVWGAGAFPF